MSKGSKKTDKGEKDGKGWKKIYLVVFTLLILVISVFAVFGDKGIIDVYELRVERDRIAADKRALEEENVRLALEVKLLESDKRYIETIARGELGMIGPGEVLYKVD